MATNEEQMKQVREEAIDRALYSGCAQAVLGTLQDEFGIGNKESFKAATALSVGIARQGETCGAIIGALSALGLVMGRERKEDTEASRAISRAILEPSQEICNRFREEIKKQFGFDGELESTLCKDIQQKIYGKFFKMSTPEGIQEFYDAGGHSKTTGCPVLSGIAAQIAAEKISKLI